MMATPSGFAELDAATHFSFLEGASSPAAMVETALALGHCGIGIADKNTVAGVVRAHVAVRELAEAAKEAGTELPPFKLAVGARLLFADGTPDVIAYPAHRHGWGRLTRLLTTGNRRAEKGDCILHLSDLIEHADGLLLIALPPTGAQHGRLAELARACPDRLWQGAMLHHGGSDRRRLAALSAVADAAGVPLLALNAPLYATPAQRPLHDVIRCIGMGETLAAAGTRLAANAERHLKSAAEMARLFRDFPQALQAPARLLARVDFSLDQLRYEYPNEPVPAGYSPQGWLETLTLQKARERWPDGVPPKLMALLADEFRIIAKAGYAPYFLTVHDIVAFAQGRGILCQGRGSAANSAVCFVLGITAVDPSKHNLLFSRFISEERKEPPDIDVDFEHERREEVMQWIYERYGRERAGIAATVIHYRPRSAVREVGKVLGMSEDLTTRLTSTVWGSFSSQMERARFAESGLDPDSPEIVRLGELVNQIMGMPRHLSQHVGGFVLTQTRLDELVPIHNAAMADRTFIEWDKDDIDALGLMKVDVLALGMLSCIRRAFEHIETQLGHAYTLDNVPGEAPDVYRMLQRGDSIGVFQVESRAQMNMLPRLKPAEFYDLVIQVAIVRPGPIQGDMVHPYLRRRQGREAVNFPSPKPPHDPDELKNVLGKTLGVPLFQEQAMKLAITAANFTPAEANRLRRSMATFRSNGGMEYFESKLVDGMVARGYEEEFARRCFNQIKGFGSYGFPESHAIAFARLVWVSAYLKCRYPAVFAAALLNAQPMGFYAPAQIVRDAAEHVVAVRAVDVNHSAWDCTLEAAQPARDGRADAALALRLGLRQITGFREEWAERIAAARPIRSLENLARAGLPARALKLLADADACASLNLNRRDAGWQALRTPTDSLPLFAAAAASELGAEDAHDLPLMAPGEEVAADYQVLRLSLRAHPLALLRRYFPGVLSAAQFAVAKNGRRAQVAGVVLVRQRPGGGNAIFITLEDESGVVNVVVWARLFETFRRAIMASRLMQVEGEVQRSPEGVMHLMATRIVDRSAVLDRLSDAHDATTPLARASEDLVHGPSNRKPPPSRGRHPRDVRIIAKSRDFH
ncbi:error-prone DNA polymerase [Sandarakinorhabdus limnophila]|uniref:error-prone DNA polymerase n=2 Tax=Sandarakinorhabdus limnophila TaxID=210512 RepID=UPI0026EBAFA3|nr:error-prone DNA polymerase [Sandarakinorhabdus limnophila]